MKYVTQIEKKEGLKSFLQSELKSHGIKFPKYKKNQSKQDQKQTGKLFGMSLHTLPKVIVDDNGMTVPRFVVDILLLIEKEMQAEGLFRKAGSVLRQKDIRKHAENGQSLSHCFVHDLTSLFKQFLRELPEPLIPTSFQESFVKTVTSYSGNDQVDNLLMLCLLLPEQFLHLLKYILQFLQLVASHCQYNKMDAQNLSVVMTPTLMQFSEKSDKINNLQSLTDVVRILIMNAERFGMVPDVILEKVEFDSLNGDINNLPDGTSVDKVQVKNKRRKSINGVFNNLRKRKNYLKPPAPTDDSPSISRRAFTPGLSTPLTAALSVDKLLSKRKADYDFEATPFTKKNVTPKIEANSLQTPNMMDVPWLSTPSSVRVLCTDLHFQTPTSSKDIDKTESSAATRPVTRAATNAAIGAAASPKVETCADQSSDETMEIDNDVVHEPAANEDVKITEIESKDEAENSPAQPNLQRVDRIKTRLSIAEGRRLDSPRSPRPRKIGSKSMRVKGSTKTGLLRVENKENISPTTNLRRSVSSQSCKNEAIKNALRRGRPNTVQSGLPAESPFKGNPMKRRPSVNVGSGDITSDSMDVVFDEATPPKVRRVIPNVEASGSALLPCDSTLPTDSVLPRASTLPFGSALLSNFDGNSEDGDGMVFSLTPNFSFTSVSASSGGSRKTRSRRSGSFESIFTQHSVGTHLSRSPTSSQSCEEENDDVCGRLLLSDEDSEKMALASADDRSESRQSVRCFRSDDYCNMEVDGSDDMQVEVYLSDEVDGAKVVRKKKAKKSTSCSIFPSKKKQDGYSMNKRHMSEADIKMNKCHLSEADIKMITSAVLAPLTTETYSILTNVGVFPEGDDTDKCSVISSDNSSETGDTVVDLPESNWQSAEQLLNRSRDLLKEDNIPPGGRPSLILLKKQRAGMVSASIQKINAIASTSSPQPRSSSSGKNSTTPVRVPSVFVKGKSYASTRRQSVDPRNHQIATAAKIPLTKYVKRQSIHSNNASSSPGSPVGQKGKSPSPPTKKGGESPSSKCGPTRQRQPFRENNSSNYKTSSPSTGAKSSPLSMMPEHSFKKPISQAPRTPRQAGQFRMPSSSNKTKCYT